MKKSNNRGVAAPMRKKTNAEIRDDNRRREMQRVAKAAQQAENEKPPKWEDLEGVYLNCRALLATPAQTAQLLNDREMLMRMGENVKKLTEMTINLTNLVKEYNSNLNAIHAKHAGKTGEVHEGHLLMDLYTIGQEYSAWMDSFNTVVLSVVNDITSLAQSFVKTDPVAETQGDAVNGNA